MSNICNYCGAVFRYAMNLPRHILRCEVRIQRQLELEETQRPATRPRIESSTEYRAAVVEEDHIPEDVHVEQEYDAVNEHNVAPVDDVPPIGQSSGSNVIPEDSSFNFSTELVKLFETCLGDRGLPDKDKETFIDLFNKAARLGCTTLEYKNLQEYKTYREALTDETSGPKWKVQNITVSKDDVPQLGDIVMSAKFFLKDTEDWLRGEFDNPTYKDNFVMEAKEYHNEDGERCFNTPEQCDAWLYQQKALRELLPHHDPVVAAIQLYSDKTLLNRKGLNCHPVKAVLLNVPFTRRISAISTIAYLSSFNERPANVGDNAWCMAKLHYMHRSMSLLLEPLKKMSWQGMQLRDPSGVYRLVYPRLLSYVMDDPESKDLYCIGKTSRPCEACKIPSDELLNIELIAGVKIASEQQERYLEIVGTRNNAERQQLINHYSILPVPCSLFGFAGQDEDTPGNIMRVLGFEKMHNDDLGVFLYIVDNIKPFLMQTRGLSAVRANGCLTKLNDRMQAAPRAGMIVRVVK